MGNPCQGINFSTDGESAVGQDEISVTHLNQRINTAATGDGIAPFTAIEIIIAAATDQLVIASFTIQSHATEGKARRIKKVLTCTTGKDRLFNVSKGIGGCDTTVNGGQRGIVENHRRRIENFFENIVAQATNQHILTRATSNAIVASTGINHISASATADGVCTIACGDYIDLITTDDLIITTATDHILNSTNASGVRR